MHDKNLRIQKNLLMSVFFKVNKKNMCSINKSKRIVILYRVWSID